MKGDPASALQLAVCFLRGDGVDKVGWKERFIAILIDVASNVMMRTG